MEENKDLIILERQTKEKIAEIINTSNLPAFVLKSMMQDFFNQLNIIGEKQYQEAIGNTSIEEEKETKEEKTEE